MARIAETEKENLSFFINNEGNIEYHKKCARCSHKCKQSYRCLDVICPRYQRR